jgi:methylenetetrahydrofolate dehydrogenase (NADP+) / methenyltetrahydrofolate cyclohydrolase
VKVLNGSELASYIKERQAKQVRALRQAHNIEPRLAIIQTTDDPVIDTYVKLKKRYGEDILIDVDIHRTDQVEVLELLKQLNKDDSVHGIIVQLPLADMTQKDEILNAVSPTKDVDGLNTNSEFDPATPTAILWLLASGNIEPFGKRVVIVGNGQLVGAPLAKILETSDVNVTVVDETVANLSEVIQNAELLVTATGVPGLITSDMIASKAVVVDAGVAVESGRTVGDLAEDVYQRDDLTITPRKGGVGPVTVCALFDNVIKAARAQISR